MKKHVSRAIIFSMILFIILGYVPEKGSTIFAEETKNNKIVLKVESTKMTVDGNTKDIDPGIKKILNNAKESLDVVIEKNK